MSRAIRLILVLLALVTSTFGDEPRALLPRPQKIQYGKGRLELSPLVIGFASRPGAEDRFAARELSRLLSARLGSKVPVAEGAAPGKAIVFNRTGAVNPLPGPKEEPGPDCREAYSLRVGPQGAEILAKSSAGIFYGVRTLGQLVEGEGKRSFLPEVDVQDWPSLCYRGVMMDLSHGPMPTEEEIKRQIDFLFRDGTLTDNRPLR